MARRFSAPYQTEPVSGLASWARNLAVFSVVAVVVSILIVRFGFLEMKPALATFFGALACAGLSILVGLAAFAAIWQNGSRGMSRILLALVIDVTVLAYPAYLALQYRKLPPIHDITTDPIDPPRFDALARLRTGDGTNTAVYAGLYSAEQQRQAYPDIEPVQLETPAQRAYQLTLQLVNRRKWLVIDERPPQPPRQNRPYRGGGTDPRSWDFARTSRSALRPTAKIRGSISARRRATSRAISAATPRGSPS